jgi:hypothetical protein
VTPTATSHRSSAPTEGSASRRRSTSATTPRRTARAGGSSA